MNLKMIGEITYNISLLLALCSLFAVFPYNPLKVNYINKVLKGLLVGLIGIGVMLNPFTLLEGLVFDVRSVLIVVTGMFYGFIPTVIGSAVLIAFRIFESGTGTVVGITVITFSALLGLAWRRYRFNKVIDKKRYRVVEFYIVGVITHIGMLLIMLILPWETAVFTLKNISLPVLAIYPLGTVIICLFLSFQVDVYDFNNRISESEKKYHAIFDSAYVGICNTTMDGRILDANQHFCEIVGYDRSELMKMTFADFTHPDDIVRSRGFLQKLITDRNAVVYDEKRYIHKNGSIVNVLLSAVMIWKEDKPVYTVTSIMDITKATTVEHNYSTLIQSIMSGLCILDETGNIIDANEQFSELVGFPKEQLETMNIADIAILQDDPGVMAKLQSVILSGNERFMDIYRRKDGAEISVEVNLVPMPDTADRFYVLVRDMTKERKLENEKLRMEAHVRNQQKLESVGTLASGVAHEINNPINGIMNYAQIILDNNPDDEETSEYAREIINETNRVASIVRSLLQFSRQKEQNYVPTDVREIVNDTMALIKTTILKDKIELKVEFSDDLPEINCRKQEIRQVLMNLITNARDAVAYNDDERIIEISSFSEVVPGGKVVKIIVRDNGPGVPEELWDKIFDPFFTTKPRDVGTGLGLSISHGIIKEHGGQLRFNTAYKGGAEFIIELPC